MCCADVVDHSSYPVVVDWVSSILEGEGLNVLINNAGQAHFQNFEEVTREMMLECLESNCIAPLMLTKVLRMLCLLYDSVVYRVTTCLENLEIQGLLQLSGKCQGKILSRKSGQKLLIVICVFVSVRVFNSIQLVLR